MWTEWQEDLTQNSRRAARNDINLHINEAEASAKGVKGRRGAGGGAQRTRVDGNRTLHKEMFEAAVASWQSAQ